MLRCRLSSTKNAKSGAERETRQAARSGDGTERKAVEAALQAGEQRYRMVADFTYDWETWVGPDGRYVYVSPSCERITGYPAEDFLAEPGLLARLVHPEDRGRLCAHCQPPDEAPVQAVVFRVIARTAEVRWVEHICQPVHGATGAYLGRRVSTRDVTDRIRAEEAYRSLVDNSLQGFSVLQGGRIVFCNEALSRMSGYSREEACAMSAEQVAATVHPDDRARVMQGMAELLAGAEVPSRGEMRLLTKDGRVRRVEVLPVRASYGGKPALQVSYLDVTEPRKAEAALRRNECRYREILGGMGAAVAVYEAVDEGRDFVFRELNPAAEKIDGVRAQDVLGRKVTEVFPGLADMGLLEVFRRVWRTGASEHQEARLYPDQTHEGWRESSVYKLPTGGVVAVYEDVTERQRAEEELSNKGEQLLRTNKMVRALSRVAVLLQSDLDPSHIMRTLGRELAGFGLSYFVALTEAGGAALRVVYASMSRRAALEARKLRTGEPRRFRFSRERLPSWVEVLQGRRSAFIADARQAGAGLLSGIPEAARERVLELGGIGPATAAAALPLAVGEEVAGVLAVWGADLREADLPALTVFAEQVAVSIHNASMFVQAQAAHNELRDLARHLQDAREEERSAVAREIHDELGQILTALKIDLRWLRNRLGPDRLDLAEKTAGMIELADQTMEATQRLASKLRPRMLDDLGLAAAVEWLAGDHGRRTGIPCVVDVRITESRIGPNGTTALFRIIQEALANVARHANASHVTVRLQETGSALEVLVQDDGIGISRGRSEDSRSFGLMGIRERVQALGGHVSIRGEPGKGTSVLVAVPVPPEGALP